MVHKQSLLTHKKANRVEEIIILKTQLTFFIVNLRRKGIWIILHGCILNCINLFSSIIIKRKDQNVFCRTRTLESQGFLTFFTNSCVMVCIYLFLFYWTIFFKVLYWLLDLKSVVVCSEYLSVKTKEILRALSYSLIRSAVINHFTLCTQLQTRCRLNSRTQIPKKEYIERPYKDVTRTFT